MATERPNRIPIWMFTLVLFIGLITLACSHSKPVSYHSVYWWKTSLDWSHEDTRILSLDRVKTVYLRLFDWDFENGRWLEAGPLQIQAPIPRQFHVVPVVYVTVAGLMAWAGLEPGHSPAQVARTPAQQAADLLARIDAVQAKAWRGSSTEVQIDADWSQRTRSAYFEVLAALQELVHQRGQKLSITLRLHQYGQRSVIPPVDSVTLLTYGAADPRVSTSQSVLDPELVARYVTPALPPYPLRLDVALPEYAQARQFNPFGRLVAMVRLAPEVAEFSPLLSPDAPLGPAWREAQKTLRWAGLVLMPNDLVKLDVPTPQQWQQTLTVLAKAGWPRSGQSSNVIVFDYDPSEWGSPTHETFCQVLRP